MATTNPRVLKVSAVQALNLAGSDRTVQAQATTPWLGHNLKARAMTWSPPEWGQTRPILRKLVSVTLPLAPLPPINLLDLVRFKLFKRNPVHARQSTDHSTHHQTQTLDSFVLAVLVLPHLFQTLALRLVQPHSTQTMILLRFEAVKERGDEMKGYGRMTVVWTKQIWDSGWIMDGSWRSKGLNVSHQTGRNMKSFPSPSLLKAKAKKNQGGLRYWEKRLRSMAPWNFWFLYQSFLIQVT
jgi:hypothetical protein